MLDWGANPSSKVSTFQLEKLAAPGVDWLFKIREFKSEIKPEVDVSQYISNKLWIGSVS